jgi:hypothetical protein
MHTKILSVIRSADWGFIRQRITEHLTYSFAISFSVLATISLAMLISKGFFDSSNSLNSLIVQFQDNFRDNVVAIRWWGELPVEGHFLIVMYLVIRPAIRAIEYSLELYVSEEEGWAWQWTFLIIIVLLSSLGTTTIYLYALGTGMLVLSSLDIIRWGCSRIVWSEDGQYRRAPHGLAGHTANIRRWETLGYSRNDMVKRMGIDRNEALRIIISVLGPAKKGR